MIFPKPGTVFPKNLTLVKPIQEGSAGKTHSMCCPLRLQHNLPCGALGSHRRAFIASAISPIMRSPSSPVDEKQEDTQSEPTVFPSGGLCVLRPGDNASATRNFQIVSAKGQVYRAPWLPNKLERQLGEAEHTGAEMIACCYVEFHFDGREVTNQPRYLFDDCAKLKVLRHGYLWAQTSARHGCSEASAVRLGLALTL